MKDQAEKTAKALKRLIQGDVYADILHRVAYSTDASIYRIVPQCVVVPRSGEDLAAVVRFAAEEGIALAPRGAGSGVAGESLCAGIALDMAKYLTRVTIHGDAEQVTCAPGIVLDELNRLLLPYGRKIGPDPSSGNRATVGGSVANNATGAHSLVYGHLDRHVESIQAVLADGRTVTFTRAMSAHGPEDAGAGRIPRLCYELLRANQTIIREAQPHTRRTRSGYTIADVCDEDTIDMARLLTGSEGTLAVFSEVTLCTVPVPAARGLIQFEFSSLEAMAEAVPLIVARDASACELMDKRLLDMAIAALPHYRDILPADTAAVLLVEKTGQTPEEVQAGLQRIKRAVGHLSVAHRLVTDPADQQRLWQSRKDAVPLLYRQRGRAHPVGFIEDVSVEADKLGEYVAGLEAISSRYGVAMSYYGHAGDGELHVRPFLDLHQPAQVETMRAMARCPGRSS